MIENFIHDEKNDCHDETGAAHRHRDEARARRLATKRDRRHEGAFTASREGEDASVRPGTRAEFVTMSSPVAVGPHVKSARPGVLMLTRRSPTATRPARGPDARTSVTRCDVSRARNTPSEPAGARTTTVSEAVAGRVLATASRSWALEWSRRVMSNVLCAPRPSPAGLFLPFVVTVSL